jgi:enamine deaminase RidA (YjgF/YER057c/UK114 family)
VKRREFITRLGGAAARQGHVAGVTFPTYAQSTRQEPKHARQHPLFEPRHPAEAAWLQPCGGGDRTRRTVYFAGQLGIDKSGKMGANAREQIEIAFENVKAALTSVGANFGNIVKLNNYIVDIGTNIAHYREVRDKYVNTAAPPASTTIGVPQLARPGALFEIEAIAVLPPK